MTRHSINIIQELQQSLGLVPGDIKRQISQRVTPIQAMGVDCDSWLQDPAVMPEWAQQAAARWVVEMWMADRDVCEPDQLLVVDKKYTHVLRSYSMGDIIAFRHAIENKRAG